LSQPPGRTFRREITKDPATAVALGNAVIEVIALGWLAAAGENDGHLRLYDQIVRHAGIPCWAHHFGLPLICSPHPRIPWTDERIRSTLELYLRRKRHWPTGTELIRDGQAGLYDAIVGRGGVRRWHAEFPQLRLRPRQRARVELMNARDSR